MMIDTHCHLSKDDYSDLDSIINNMGDNIMIASGSNPLTNKEVLDLCHKYRNIYGTLGIHPMEAESGDINALKFIEDNLLDPKVVGIGEIGLDYHWRQDNKDLQKELFTKQIALARKYNKTFVIHSRDANEEVYALLKEINYPNMKSVMHCYSGDLILAKKLVALGVRLGIGGVITFKNADKLREVVAGIDINYLLLETDSPYLAPVPFRGSQNEPANILIIAEKIAEIKGITTKEVLDKTTVNSISQFDLKL